MATEQQQVETLVVGYDDRATDAIDATTSALNRMGAAAENAGDHIEVLETQVRRQGRTGEQILRQFGDAERLTARLTAVTRQYQRAKDDLEASELSAAQKAEQRLVLQAREQIAIEKVIAQHERAMAAVRAKIAATDAMARGAAAATAAAGSWAGAMAKVYETASEAASAVNGTARALQLLNADFQAGRASFAEWIAGARGLENALRGVSAVQKSINDNTGVSRQTSTVIPIGPLKYQTTGSGASGADRLTLVTGDAEASARRLDDITAAFAAADEALDRYRESLGLVDVAQRRYEAGLAELRNTIRRAGIEEAEGARILAAYTAQHDPAVAKTAALKKEQEQLATSYGRVMAQIDPGIAAQQRYEAALATLRAGAAAAGKSAEQLAADERLVAEAISPAAIAARQQASALQDLEDRLDRTGAAARQAAANQTLLDKALAEQRISPERHATLTKALQEQSGAATAAAGSVKLAAHQVTNLSYQVQDFGVQLASGQSPFMAIAQQGPQAVMAVGGLRAAITLLMSPVTLAIGGIAALVGAMTLIAGRALQISAHTRQLSVDIQAMGNASGVTATQLRGIEAQMRQQAVSSDAAYASVRTLAGARGLSPAMVGDVVSISRDMAASTGDVAGAVKTLTDALTEGYQGIRKLDDQFNFLTTSERKQIETMARHGDQAGMLSVAVGALHRQFDGLHDKSLSPLGAALERVTAAYNRLVEALAAQPIVIRGLEGLTWLLEKTAGGIAPTRAEQIAGIRKELGELEAQYARLPEKTAGVQAAHEQIILRRIELLQQLSKLEKDEAAAAPKTSTGAPRTAGTSNASLGPPDPAAAKYVDEQAAAYERLSEAMRGNAAQRALAQADLRAEEEIRDRRLRGAAADEIRDIRRRETLLQLRVAIDDVTRAAAGEVAGAELLARAYGVSAAAVREAAIHQKALAEVARGTIEPYDRIVDRLRKVDDAQRALQAAQFAQTLRDQAQDANRLAAAWSKGAAAAREAAVANEVLAEARKRGLDPTRDAGEITQLSRDVLTRDTAQRAAQFSQMAAEQRRSVELANAEWALLGQSNSERAKQVAMLQVANDLRDKGVDLTDAGTQAYVRQAGELAKVDAIIQEAGQNAANITQPIATGLEDVIVGTKRAGDAFRSLAEDLKRIAARVLITKPFETAITGELTKLMSGPVTMAVDNTPKPANDSGMLARVINQVNGGLGSSADRAMWVRLASGSAPLDFSGTPMPIDVKSTAGLESLADQVAVKYGLDANLFKAVITRESSWNPNAVNPSTGAAGLGQVMPGNWRAYGLTNPTDPAQNLDAAARILKEHLDRAGGDVSKALSTYSGHIKTSGDAYVSAVMATKSAYDRGTASMETAGRATAGVSDAQERALQVQLDAIEVQRSATDSTQTLTATQQSWVDSALGLTGVTKDASSVIEVQSRAVSHIGENAISAADGLAQAGDSATKFGTAAADGADTFLGGIQKLLGGGSDWVSGLFGGSSEQQQKVIRNADGSTSFAPATRGVGGSWLDAKVFGSGESARPSPDFVGPMPQETGIGGWNPTWGQMLQGVGGIASGAMMATQKGATAGQKIGGGLMAAGGIAAMIPGGQIVGGVMMAAGALLSAVTGAKDRGEKYSISHITLQGNGKYALGHYDQDNGGDPTRFNADAAKVAKGLNDIIQRLNLTPTAGDSFIDSKTKSAEQAALDLLKGMKSGVPEIAYAIAHESAVSLEDMLSHLEFANAFDTQVKALRSSISDLFSQFQTGVDAGNSLGRTLLQFVDNAQTVFAVSKLPGFARGTVSAPSGWAIVGEEGPEVVRLSGGERIWDAKQSAAMLARMGRRGDDTLIHLRGSDELAAVRRALGTAGTVNPYTGLLAFEDGESNGSGSGTGGGGTASGHGGENAAHGEVSSSTADRDAAYGGGWGTDRGGGGGGLVDTISGWVSAVTGWMSTVAGWHADTVENTQAQTEAMAAIAGLSSTAVAAAVSAAAQFAGPGLTGMIEALTGEKGAAPAISHDFGDLGFSGGSALSAFTGTIGERAAGSGRAGASAGEIDATLKVLGDAIKSDPALANSLIGSTRMAGGGGLSVSDIANSPGVISWAATDIPSLLADLDTAASQFLSVTGTIPDVLQKALNGANAEAVRYGFAPATATRQAQEEQARQKAEAQQVKFDAVGLVKDRVSELNGIVASLGAGTFSPIGKDFDQLAADMKRAADAYVAAGQTVPDGLFGAMKQMEALGAARKRLLDEVAGVTIETSPEQQKVEQLRGKWSNTATDLVKAFASVGIVGDELAAKLNEGFGNALKKEQGSYSKSLDVALRKAKGEEGYDSAVALIDGYKTSLKDVNALWPEGAERAAQLGKVTGTLTANMQGLVKSGSITSASLQQIITTFADTPAVVDAARAALQQLNDATTEAARAFNAGIDSRMYAALGNSRGSGLLSLDEQQRQELKAAVDAGRDTTRLQQVQKAERQQRAFEAAQQDVLGAYDQQIAAVQSYVTGLQDGALKIAQTAKQFRQAFDGLAIADNSPLSPLARLEEGRRQFDAAYGKARTGSDTEKADAMQTLLSLGPQLVQLARAYYASSDSSDYERVRAVFDQFGQSQLDTVDTAQKQLDTANAQLKELQAARNEAAKMGQRQYGALTDLLSVMSQSYVIWQTALTPLQQLTGAKSTSLEGMLAVLTKDTLPALVEWAKTQGPDALQQLLVTADQKLGWKNNTYRYQSPYDIGGADFQTAALSWLGERGYVGAWDGNANAYIVSRGLGSAFTDFQAAWLQRDKPVLETDALQARLQAFTNADVEAAFGSQPDIIAARQVNPFFDLRDWFNRFGMREVLAGQRHIPGFAAGTLDTPPGAVWVGERGPELLWQGGGAAVASSADSLRIASVWQAAANDRRAGVAELRSARQTPARVPQVNTAGLERRLEKLVDLMERLLDVSAKAGDGTLDRMDRLIDAAEEQATRAKFRDAKAA